MIIVHETETINDKYINEINQHKITIALNISLIGEIILKFISH